MRALLIPRPGELQLTDLTKPEIGPFEALVRIRGCGICATTDWELIHGRQPFHRDYPAILGHEAVGEVVETGPKVQSFHTGDFVKRPVAIWPGEKRGGFASAWGGFAEYGIVRDRIALVQAGQDSYKNDYTALRQQVVPAGLALPDAILAISLSETASWFRHLPSVAGKSVCISGTGVAGLSMIFWSLLGGAEKIFVLGRRDTRLDLARRLGATHGINVQKGPVATQLRDLNGGAGVDFFLEAVGLPDQINLGLSLLAPGGILAIYGVPEGQRYELAWSTCPERAKIVNLPAEEHLAYGWVADLIRRGMLPTREVMTHSWKFDQFREAFDAVAAGDVVKGWIEI
ncbi:MAG: zinc-binding dehydrogenase [Methylacidiphilales bacterium]|nr:zinc-binding dehydrogenase [Candidatus Methylacidiphilales bacterium]